MAPDPEPRPDPPRPGREAPGAEAEAVLAVHRAFYEAFEARDIDAMSEVWEHSDRVVCTHPGWRTLHGWASVAASWYALFGGESHLQFILTDQTVEVAGEVAWTTADENLIGTGGGDPGGGVGGTVAALNVFVRRDGRWQMVAHHGSPVVGRSD